MKTMVLQFMLEAPRPCKILCFSVRTTVEYLNRYVSIGQLLQHISESIVVCARSRPKMLTKTYYKEVYQAFRLPAVSLLLENPRGITQDMGGGGGWVG